MLICEGKNGTLEHLLQMAGEASTELSWIWFALTSDPSSVERCQGGLETSELQLLREETGKTPIGGNGAWTCSSALFKMEKYQRGSEDPGNEARPPDRSQQASNQASSSYVLASSTSRQASKVIR